MITFQELAAKYQELAQSYIEYQQNIITISKFLLFFIMIILIITAKIYISSYNHKVSKESKNKLRVISKMERRPIAEQVGLIIDMYIDAYSEKHNINWDEYLY